MNKEKRIIEIESVILKSLQKKYQWTEEGLMMYVMYYGESLRSMADHWLDKIVE